MKWFIEFLYIPSAKNSLFQTKKFIIPRCLSLEWIGLIEPAFFIRAQVVNHGDGIVHFRSKRFNVVDN